MALEEITKGMSNAAEIIDGNFKKVVEKETTEWVKSTTFLDGATGEVNYKIKNGVFIFHGYVTPAPNSSASILGAKTFFVFPNGSKPDHDIYLNGVPSPSSTNSPQEHAAVLTVGTNGNLTVQRASGGTISYRFEGSYFV